MPLYDEETISNIIENVDIVEYIGQFVELHKKGQEYFGNCPFHNEDTPSFSVTPNKKKFYCFGCGSGGNVITFAKKYFNIPFFSAVERLVKLYNVDVVEVCKSETVQLLKTFKHLSIELPPVTHEILNPSVLERFDKADITEWEAEGIDKRFINRYGVMYDVSSNRIIYPVYDINGNLINVKGRTRCENYKDLGIAKYINYYKVGTVNYFQGLNMKKKIVQDKNEIIIFEGVKSCMKADTFGYYNSVSAETSVLNPYQIRLLLQLKCNVVIAFDSDVDIHKIYKNVSMLKKFTNVFVIVDKNHLLGNKDSPVDKGKDVWIELYETKQKV